MHQIWDRLLFLHWPMPVEELRPLIPASLEIDTFDGVAWVAVTPLVVRGVRPPRLPALPGFSQTLEINVRTYVHYQGQSPGVWFFSLDASNPLAVWGARWTFALNYLSATMHMEFQDDEFRLRSRRTHRGVAPAELDVAWRRTTPMPEAAPGSRDFFFVERYCLYAASGQRLYRSRIHHRPWPLRHAELTRWSSSMVESHGLPTPGEKPLLHALAEPLDVKVWRLERVE